MHKEAYSAAEGGLMDVEPKRKRDPKKAHLHEMLVKRGHKGGYIAKHMEHRHDDGQVEHEHPDRNAEFPLADNDALHDHIEEHMGEPNPGEEQGESPASQASEEQEGQESDGGPQAQA